MDNLHSAVGILLKYCIYWSRNHHASCVKTIIFFPNRSTNDESFTRNEEAEQYNKHKLALLLRQGGSVGF